MSYGDFSTNAARLTPPLPPPSPPSLNDDRQTSPGTSRAAQPPARVDGGVNDLDPPPPKEEKEGAPSTVEILATIYAETPDGATGLVCSKPGDPTDNTGWRPHEASDVGTVCIDTNNNYFSCSSFRRADEGHIRATKDAFAPSASSAGLNGSSMEP